MQTLASQVTVTKTSITILSAKTERPDDTYPKSKIYFSKYVHYTGAVLHHYKGKLSKLFSEYCY